MDFSRIEAIQQRIADIETKIGIRHQNEINVEPSFDALLKAELKRGKLSPESPDFKIDDQSKNDFSDLITAAAKKFGVDEKLVSAVAETESNFSQKAISPVGAIGVMQLMPETAESLGVNPYNAKENIEGGTRYLRQMLDTFDGDVKKAVAAYNAGPQAVKDYGGIPPYRETIGYVDKVLDLYR